MEAVLNQLHMVLSVILVLILGFFGLYAIFNWYHYRDAYRPFRSIAFAMGGIFLFLEFLTIIGLSIEGLDLGIGYVLWVDFIAFFRIAALTIVGIHACKTLGLHSFPLIMDYFIYTPDPQLQPEAQLNLDQTEAQMYLPPSGELAADYAESTAEIGIVEEDHSEPAELSPPSIKVRELLLVSLGIAYCRNPILGRAILANQSPIIRTSPHCIW